MSDGYVWTPSPEVVEAANTTRFARAHDLDGHADLLRRSIDEPEWFWDAVVRWIDVEFHTPYRRVLDHSGGIQACRWFTGATLNLAWSCVGRHAQSEASARSAVIAEREDGAV